MAEAARVCSEFNLRWVTPSRTLSSTCRSRFASFFRLIAVKKCLTLGPVFRSTPCSATATMRNVRASFLVSAVVGTAVATRVAFLPAGHDTVCGAQGYHGTVGPASSPYRVYVIPDSCSLEIGSASSIPDTHVLVHVQRAKADVRLLGDDWSYPEELHSFLRRAATNEFASQAPLDPHHVLQLASFFESTVVAVPEATLEHLDAILPRFLSATVLQSTPVVPVAHSAVQSLRRTIEHVTYSKHVASLVETLNVTEIYNDLTYLSGEDPGSPILERNSLSAGARVAADWLQGQFEDSGATCEQVAFRDGWAPNVLWWARVFVARSSVAHQHAVTSRLGTMGRACSSLARTTTRAGGRSPTARQARTTTARARRIYWPWRALSSGWALASIHACASRRSRARSRAWLAVGRTRVRPGLAPVFARADDAAELLREQDASVTLMIQADMLAYHDPLEPMQLGQPDRSVLRGDTPDSLIVAQLFAA